MLVFHSSLLEIASHSSGQGVYYKVFVSQRHEKSWRLCFTETRWQDFILYDPQAPQTQLLIPANKTNVIVRGVNDGTALSGVGAASFFQSETLPDGIKALLERHNFQVETNVLFGTIKKKMSYVEECFSVGEQIACLGIVRDDVTGTQRGVTMKTLQSMQRTSLTELYFNQHQWSGTEKSVWNELMNAGPSLLASDDPVVFQVCSLHSVPFLIFRRE
jgi:hypothetical protein